MAPFPALAIRTRGAIVYAMGSSNQHGGIGPDGLGGLEADGSPADLVAGLGRLRAAYWWAEVDRLAWDDAVDNSSSVDGLASILGFAPAKLVRESRIGAGWSAMVSAGRFVFSAPATVGALGVYAGHFHGYLYAAITMAPEFDPKLAGRTRVVISNHQPEPDRLRRGLDGRVHGIDLGGTDGDHSSWHRDVARAPAMDTADSIGRGDTADAFAHALGVKCVQSYPDMVYLGGRGHGKSVAEFFARLRMGGVERSVALSASSKRLGG